jgi:hypothetical protein
VPLRLMGLAVLANPLRPDTAGVIECLQKAQIRCAMVTGDHLRTAVSVAHQCCILPGSRPVLLMDAAADAPPAAALPARRALEAAGGGGGGEAERLAGATLAAVASSHSLGNLAGAGEGAGGGGSPSPRRGGSGGVVLSVLHPDGSVTDAAPRGAALAAVMTGDMECAVTGKGFDALLARPDPELVQPMLRRGAVFARMSPDNKRDLMHLLGNGLEAAPAARPLGLHVGAHRGRGGLATRCRGRGPGGRPCPGTRVPCSHGCLCAWGGCDPRRRRPFRPPLTRPPRRAALRRPRPQASAATAPTTAARSRRRTSASPYARPRRPSRRP